MLRRYGTDFGTRLRRLSRNRLARQEHDAGRSETWDLVLPRRNFDNARFAAGRAAARSLRDLRSLHHGMSDWRNHRAAPARRATLHFLSHDRIERLDPARIASAHRRSDLRLRRLP